MQRWIALGLVAMMLLCGGALFAFRSYKQNRPHPVWVPLPVNAALPVAKRDEVIAELKKKIGDSGNLISVCKDVSLAKKWGLDSDEEAAAELGRRLFVRPGDADTPMGKVPAIHIGVNGKNKEREVSGQIAMRLIQDVWKILGIEPPANQE